MASTKDMMWFPGVCFPGCVCAKASELAMVRQYGCNGEPLPFFPCGRRWRGRSPRRMRGMYPRRETPHPPSMLRISGALSHKGRGGRKIHRRRGRGHYRLALHQSAALGDAAQMIVGVAKGVLDHGQPLEVVADLG